MLWRTSALGDFRLEATDGAIGAIRDSLFDDRDWILRWFVVDTGTWLSGRKVLLAPGQVELTDSDPRTLALGITREQVRASPPLDSDAPVSRHYERRLTEHYGWPDYWAGITRPALPVSPEPSESTGSTMIPTCGRPAR